MTRFTTQEALDSRPPTHDVKRYAGKVDLDEVFVADWHREDRLTHSVTVDWPCHHALYTPAPHSYTLLLFAESVRQSLAVSSHLGLGIPLGHRMGLERLSCTVSPNALAIGPEPAAVELTVTYDTVARRKSGLARVAARIRAVRDGELLGTALVQYTAYPPALYNRLRGDHADVREAFARTLPPGPAVDPALVGRTDPHDVVLAPDTSHTGTAPPRRWTLRTDTTHRVLFDHPHDHVPGMVLLEAASQAVQASSAPRRIVPIGLDSAFSRYVELDQPCTVLADEAQVDSFGLVRRRIDGLQGGGPVFTAQITGMVDDSVLAPRRREYLTVGN